MITLLLFSLTSIKYNHLYSPLKLWLLRDITSKSSPSFLVKAFHILTRGFLFYVMDCNLFPSIFNLMLKMDQICPWRPFRLDSVIYTPHHHHHSWSTLLSGSARCSKLILHFCCTSTRISQFSKKPGYSCGEWYLEAKIWGIDVLNCIGVLLLSGPFSGQS